VAEYLDGTYLPPVPATTVGGVAAAELLLASPGTVLLRAESGAARNSDKLELRLQPRATPTPPPAPTSTQAPEPTAPPATATAEPTPLPAPTAEPAAPQPPGGEGAGPAGLLLGLGISGLAATAGLWLTVRRCGDRPAAVRRAILGIIGGMAGYLLYILTAVRPESWAFWPEAAWAPAAGLAALVAAGALLGMLLVPLAPQRGAS
jgi:hypothetical protein